MAVPDPTALSPPRQHPPQRRPRVAGLALHQRLGRAAHHHRTTVRAAFGPQVDDPIGFGDHVQVVLDHDHAVAAVDQAVQHADQLFDIGHVQAHRRLVVTAQDPATLRVTTLGDEKQFNTFLRLTSPGVIAALREAFPELPEQPDPKTVFVKLRELRNAW